MQAGIALIKLGDLLGNPNFPNLGKAADAHAKYQVALSTFRRLDAAAPTNPRVRRYLGITLERIGTLHEQASRWSEATAAYQESFEIRKALASTEPSHNDIQRDSRSRYEKLGNIQRQTGNPAAAAVNYRDALGQFERLAKLRSLRTRSRRGSVAISREKLSGVVESLGRHTEALDLMRAALAHASRACRPRPGKRPGPLRLRARGGRSRRPDPPAGRTGARRRHRARCGRRVSRRAPRCGRRDRTRVRRMPTFERLAVKVRPCG